MWRLACRLIITATKGTEVFPSCVQADDRRLDYSTFSQSRVFARRQKDHGELGLDGLFNNYRKTHAEINKSV